MRTEKQWEKWWAEEFAEVSKPEYKFICADLTDDFGYPALSLDTPQGKIQIEHKSGDICKVYWPGGAVGRLCVNESGDAFVLSLDGSYGWHLEPERYLDGALAAAICLLEWAATKITVEIAAKQED